MLPELPALGESFLAQQETREINLSGNESQQQTRLEGWKIEERSPETKMLQHKIDLIARAVSNAEIRFRTARETARLVVKACRRKVD